MDKLIELLRRHRPELAVRVRARLAGPQPDGILVLGSRAAPTVWLATELARLLQARVERAAGDLHPDEACVARTRAVVWVCSAATPCTDREAGVLRGLAGAIDEVHLVVLGHAAAGVEGAASWLYSTVPRLAGRPAVWIADRTAPERLVAALRLPTAVSGAATTVSGVATERNALRLARTGLAEVLAGRQARLRAAERFRLATELRLRRRVEQLRARRLAVAAQWPKRVRADLTELRLRASSAAADGLRRLRNQARAQLEGADRSARAGLPRRVNAAANRLVEEITEQLDEALARVEAEVRAEVGPVSRRGSTDWRGLAPPDSPARGAPAGPEVRGARALVTLSEAPAITRRWEDRVVLVVGASAGIGLARLIVAGGATLGGLADEVTVPLGVGVGVGAAWWLARGRRAGQERAMLTRWIGEALADLRGRLDTVIAARVMDAQRRLGPLVDRSSAVLVATLDSALREQELLASAVTSRLNRFGEQDALELAQLTAGCRELDRLLCPEQPRSGRAA